MPRDRDNAAFATLNQQWLDVRADGWAGRRTRSAWLERTGFEGDGVSAPSPWPLPDERSLVDFYGPPGPSELITVTTPYRMRLAWDHGTTVGRVRCHRKIAESLMSCLEGILTLYGDLAAVRAARMDLFAGVYRRRPQRGGRAWSLHAWGAAIDIDSLRNGNHTPWPVRATMPIDVIEIFERHGWKSGARAWGRDAMHFQATQ